MNFKYILGCILCIPLLPIMYFQGKKIRHKTPKLPEAIEPKGFIDNHFEKTLEIITIGESTIAGVGVEKHKNGFTGTLAKQLSKNLQKNINWRVYAKSGYTAKQICSKIVPKIEEKNADIIVIGLGGNDAFTLNTPKKWSKDINNLIYLLQLKFPETPIYFTNMPPIKEFPAFTKLIKFVIGNLVEILGKELKKDVKAFENVYYNDENITLKTWSKRHKLPDSNSTMYFSDGVHPSEFTYKVWGIEMADFISKKKNPK
ncbi:SGNH/GDSL hydrolase family protein [uncultured Polaribacter sp.]|uniref:SGNH/GDSL hydrolase family protein n=1 Tax=uncultured Polaribacter sp. TaxID=174711 RepID=UPI0026361419|nr:SGNH/GDSL hydrolase family protein [uncultured Polaribacter sp.]